MVATIFKFYGVHYLEPEPLGVKPYSLLREVLFKARQVGVAKVAFQRREHLCCLRPLGEILVLHTMHYSDEVLPREGLAPTKAKVPDQELEMAFALVKAMTRPFKPEEYHDEYAAALEKVIQARLQGESLKPVKERKTETRDLMSSLKASIEAALKESEEKAAAHAGKRKPTPAT